MDDKAARDEIICDGLTAAYERMTAYIINHRGAALYCSDAMRAAYSDEHVRAETAERRCAELVALVAESALAIETCIPFLPTFGKKNIRKLADVLKQAALTGDDRHAQDT
jgi:hypothetical protein